MSNTILEQIRHKYEEIEQYEKVISKSLTYRDNNPNENIVSETIIKRCKDKIQQNSRDIIDLFEDKNENFKQEKLIMTGNVDYMNSNLCLLKPVSINKNNNYYSNLLMKKRKADIWVNFYDKIKEIKMLNKSGNDINHTASSDKIFNNLISEINLKTLFTNEENFGKCLDLHELYHEYINIPDIFNSGNKKEEIKNNNINNILIKENVENMIKFDYLNYLKNIDNFKNIPMKVKKSNEYIKYLKHLTQYLKSFFIKIYPLVNFNEIQDIIDSKFEDDQEHLDNNKTIPLNEDEEEKTNDKKKLFCEICKKSFAKETLMDAHMKSKKHLKKVNLSNNKNIRNDTIQEKNKLEEEIIREIKYQEYQIIHYKDILQNIIDNTISKQ